MPEKKYFGHLTAISATCYVLKQRHLRRAIKRYKALQSMVTGTKASYWRAWIISHWYVETSAWKVNVSIMQWKIGDHGICEKKKIIISKIMSHICAGNPCFCRGNTCICPPRQSQGLWLHPGTFPPFWDSLFTAGLQLIWKSAADDTAKGAPLLCFPMNNSIAHKNRTP